MAEINPRKIEKQPKSRLPKVQPGMPAILIDKKAPHYYGLSIQELYILFFSGKREKGQVVPPLIEGLAAPGKSKYREIVSFLLPEELFSRIEVFENKQGELYIHPNDYEAFLNNSSPNRKITKALFELFAENSNNFISSIQSNMLLILKNLELTQNETLKEQSEALCQKMIAPPAICREAYDACYRLLHSGKNEDVAKCIANIFISAFLGLYSMEFFANSESESTVHKRIYLLNELGMKYIWTPELITSDSLFLDSVRQLYQDGRYADAFEKANIWILSESAKSATTDSDRGTAFWIRGASLYFHSDAVEEHKRLQGKEDLERSVSFSSVNPEAHFILYQYYLQIDKSKANDHLEQAFRQGYPAAVVQMAFYLQKGSGDCPQLTKQEVVAKLDELLASNRAGQKQAECAFYMGLFSEDSDTQLKYLNESAELGYEEARKRLVRMKRQAYQHFPSFSTSPEAPCCFVNTLTGNNYSFIASLPDGEWAVYTVKNENPRHIAVQELDCMEALFPEIRLRLSQYLRRTLFLFLSEDTQRNLNEALSLLDQLYNAALDVDAQQRDRMIDSIDIYISAKYEFASTLIDANISDMGDDLYFKVHILDEEREIAHELLSDAPLFIPYLQGKPGASVANVVLFGSTLTNYQIIKESIACSYRGDRFSISIAMIGNDAAHLEKQFRQECPGIYSSSGFDAFQPTFIPCVLEEEDFPAYFYRGGANKKLQEVLRAGNYFVVDLADDNLSIRFARMLRCWLLRSDNSFQRTPFIAVKCSSTRNSYLVEHLTLSGRMEGQMAYNRHILFPFGMTDMIYSYSRLVRSPRLEEAALQIHKSYPGGTERQKERSYYAFSYNADSSLCAALGLSYRLFASGVYFTDITRYNNFGVFDKEELQSRFQKGYDSILDELAAMEHFRWCGFLLSRGWEKASFDQVEAYLSQATGSSHQHMLAKLHPFLRPWSDLESDEIKRIFKLFDARTNYKNRPKEMTKAEIRSTVTALSWESSRDVQER